MYDVGDYRPMVADGYTARLGREGFAGPGFDTEEFGEWLRAASEEDLGAVEGFMLRDFDGRKAFPATLRNRSSAPTVAAAHHALKRTLELFSAGIDDVVRQPMHIRASLTSDRKDLLDIWLRSVRASHTFLTEQDIQSLLPSVSAFFRTPQLELWVLCTDIPVGFMSLSGAVVEALFITPDHFRQGGGTVLLEHARRLKGPLLVDVDERNPEALQFYLARGFSVAGRSLVDAAGRPFPLVHLREVSG